MYVADYIDGLEIIDISNKSSPKEIGGFHDGGLLYDVCVSGSYAYLADYYDGLEIIDISNKSSPVKVREYHDSDNGNAQGVYFLDPYIFLADRNDGLEIIDTSNKSNPKKVGGYTDFDYVTEVNVFDSKLYLTASGNLLIFSLTITEHTLNIIEPKSSSYWKIEDSCLIQWGSTGNITKVNIELYHNDSICQTIVNNIDNDGNYQWIIPSNLESSKSYQVKISDSNDLGTFILSEYFEIGFEANGSNTILYIILGSIGGGILVILIVIIYWKKKSES